MGFSEIVDTIKSVFGKSDNSYLMLGDYFSKEILRQYKKTIKHINKELKKSLREYPYAHSEFEICITNNDLRKAIIELYRKQGFEVKQTRDWDKSYIKIIFDGWESEQKSTKKHSKKTNRCDDLRFTNNNFFEHTCMYGERNMDCRKIDDK